MRLIAGEYELVEHDRSTPDNLVFAFPGGETATYCEVMAFFKKLGLRVNEIGPIISRGKRDIGIGSQLGKNQAIMRELVEDDSWRK